MKKIILLGIVVLSLFFSTYAVNADPTVETITTEPESPKSMSTVKIIATISGDDILSVDLTVAECDESQCYASHPNLPMSLNVDGKYETEVTLENSVANHIQYRFLINDSGIEYTLAEDTWKTYFDTSSENSGTSNGSNGGDNGTPGFEIFTVVIAIFLSLIVYKKKR